VTVPVSMPWSYLCVCGGVCILTMRTTPWPVALRPATTHTLSYRPGRHTAGMIVQVRREAKSLAVMSPLGSVACIHTHTQIKHTQQRVINDKIDVSMPTQIMYLCCQ
jgi:ligand-binding SRPBCC domain-containing protein